MTLPSEIPLFPLRVVLFPGMLLPLHIFEPRYRRMLQVCQERQEPFGLVLANSAGLPRQIGTAAHLQRVERLPDGRSNILVLGRERFRVQNFRYDQPYLVGQVEAFPLPGARSQAALRHADKVRTALRDYMIALETGAGQHLSIQDLPDEADGLANLVAMALQVEPEVKQTLLEAASVAEMLRLARRLLDTETQILRYMERTRPLADEAGPAPPN